MKMHHPLALAVLWTCLASNASAQAPTQKSPPAGIEIPAEKRGSLSEQLQSLWKEIHAVSKSTDLSPALAARLPDVEIFAIAVQRALEWNEFYDLKQIAAAEVLLKEGASRLASLKGGTTPWTHATGLVVRGFRSRIDGSVQPYGVVVPEGYPSGPARMDIWLHGRNDKLTELAFITERMKSKGEFTPAGALVLHPYGRFCNGFKFAGETDVLEAMEDAVKQYGVDQSHIAIRGFSMGGAGCWHLAAHHTSKWAVANPGAGFVETARYAKVFAPDKPVPPWWEQVLWRLYDVPGYAASLANRPVVAYSGEIDSQKQAADLMVAAAAEKGVSIPHLIGPQTAHKYHPETKLQVARKVDEAAVNGSPKAPPKVHLTTFTLRYNQMDWVSITGLEKHWEESSVSAQHLGGGKIAVTTKGVTSLTLTPPKEWTGKDGWMIQCDGTPLSASGNQILLKKGPKGWQHGDGQDKGLHKRPGLQGPIDDAFQESFIFVRPTGSPMHPKVDAWARQEMERAIKQWELVFRGKVRVVADSEVTAEQMEHSHLVLWGDPGSNRLWGRMLLTKTPSLFPFQWDAKELRLGARVYSAENHAPVVVYPNPLAPHRYVVTNSSFTFRQGSDTTNALQTPKLPDWAVVDVSVPPDVLNPGRIEDAGFFDEQWKLPPL